MRFSIHTALQSSKRNTRNPLTDGLIGFLLVFFAACGLNPFGPDVVVSWVLFEAYFLGVVIVQGRAQCPAVFFTQFVRAFHHYVGAIAEHIHQQFLVVAIGDGQQ